jgi:hypothetical protein
MIRILSKNKRLKQLIKIHTNKWNTLEKRHVQCFNDIGFFIENINKTHKRWVKKDQFEEIKGL